MKKSLILALILGCFIGFTSCTEEVRPDLNLSIQGYDYSDFEQVGFDPDTLKGGCPICPPN